jgi:hypothetical protein
VHILKLKTEHAIMVFFFKSNVVDPEAFIYVGKDKVESKVPYTTILMEHPDFFR